MSDRFTEQRDELLTRKPTSKSDADSKRRERYRSSESRDERELKWNNTFIPCIRHNDRRCNRSNYVKDGHRRCATCFKKHADGSMRLSCLLRQRKRDYSRMMKARGRYGASAWSMNALQIWERCTGMKAEFPIDRRGRQL